MKNIGKDKWLHFYAGLVISLLVLIGMYFRGGEYQMYGFFVATIVGAFKELYWDLYKENGTSEFEDFLFTLFGGIAGEVLFLLIKFALN
jgi:hypothetical protein